MYRKHYIHQKKKKKETTYVLRDWASSIRTSERVYSQYCEITLLRCVISTMYDQHRDDHAMCVRTELPYTCNGRCTQTLYCKPKPARELVAYCTTH